MDKQQRLRDLYAEKTEIPFDLEIKHRAQQLSEENKKEFDGILDQQKAETKQVIHRLKTSQPGRIASRFQKLYDQEYHQHRPPGSPKPRKQEKLWKTAREIEEKRDQQTLLFLREEQQQALVSFLDEREGVQHPPRSLDEVLEKAEQRRLDDSPLNERLKDTFDRSR